MVLNAAVQALRQAEDLKQKLLQGSEESGLLTSRTLLLTQLQKAYQKVLLIDLDYALDKKVEQDLWNVGFKNQIETLQNSAKDKKNPRRAESQTLLSWVLQAATGFYVCLLHQICTAFKLNLPFRCNIPIATENLFPQISPRPPQPASCWYICQHCLVHLGDLARYSRQTRVADSFYRQALTVSPRNGQPYNQLGLLRAARGDRLGAAYYHARGLAVGGPFPPAANNLARTLQASSTIADGSLASEAKSQMSGILGSPSHGSIAKTRLSLSVYTSKYMAVHHRLLTGEGLEQAEQMLPGLSSTLTALVATQHAQEDILLQMCCLDLYAVYSITDGNKLSMSVLSEDEKKAFNIVLDLVAGTFAALLLPAHTTAVEEMINYPALPAVKILLEWLKLNPEMLKEAAFTSRLQLWPGLCTLLTGLQQCIKDFSGDIYETIPLPEDEELQGYLPIDQTFSKLKFSNRATSHLFSCGDNANVLPEPGEEISEKEILAKKKHSYFSLSESETLKKDKTFVESLRAYRLIQLGKWLAAHQKDSGSEYINISIKDELTVFTPIQNTVESNPDLQKAIEELSLLREKRLSECLDQDAEAMDDFSDDSKSSRQGGTPKVPESNQKSDSDLLPPIIISEADFMEKVREKKAGILKPQGSLERARIEKAALCRMTHVETLSPESPQPHTSSDCTPDAVDNQDTGSSCSTVSQDGNMCSDVGSLLEPPAPREKVRRVRTNVAMQAILKKQEETSKQVKFLTPVTTPDSIGEASISPPSIKDSFDKKKIIQPKVIKSLASIPTDRKTGGILSLKDKSAGYPHLVNIEPPQETKSDSTELSSNDDSKIVGIHKGDKTESKQIQTLSQQDKHPASPNKQTTSKTTAPSPSGKIESLNRSAYPPWSDGNSNVRTQNDITANHGHENKFTNPLIQNKPSNFSYFSSPDLQTSSITLPVVNPKEIDVRSAALQKQKSLLQGLGESVSPVDSFNKDNMPQYNYWSGASGTTPVNLQNQGKNYYLTKQNRLPPRLANLKKGADFKMQDPQSVGYPQGDGSANPQISSAQKWKPESGQPQHTWWKPSNQDANYDRNYQQNNISTPRNFQQNYLGPMQNTSQQGLDYQDPKISYNYNQNLIQGRGQQAYGDAVPHSPRYNPAPNYQDQPSPYIKNSGNFSRFNTTSQGMYPQFSSKFGMPQQQVPKPAMGNEYTISPYPYSAHQFGLNVNQSVPNPSQPSNLNDLMMPGNQYLRDFQHSVSNDMPFVDYAPPRMGVEVQNLQNYEGMNTPDAADPYNYQGDAAGRSNMYSLFSGGAENWGPGPFAGASNVATTQQSLWSGPGPSPLERLLEQQKQLRYPPNE